MAGTLVGSPDYMAPERIEGRLQGPPSDLWSLGATLCAAVAGHSPFSRATTMATLHAVLYEQPEIPAASGPLRELLAGLLLKDPARRPTLDGTEETLERLLAPPARSRSRTRRRPPWPHPHPPLRPRPLRRPRPCPCATACRPGAHGAGRPRSPPVRSWPPRPPRP
ncbi:protein kinase domain-containing protein [Streptomyces griseocarneus]|uniref:protein kinase domain-containing protein n=1 Tax=Streptomyces griseocarneus TaxID=51201 RepID=UPI0024189AEB|nr:hypothetical protein [Streptomyces griseocarneus]